MPFIEYQNGDVVYQSLVVQGFFPVWSIPACMRDPILEVSANYGLPVELCAQAALGTVSLVSQFFINVQCPPYDPAPPTLFFLGVSNSSGGKSVLEQRFLRSVTEFERKQEETIEVAMTNYRAEMKIWEDDGRQLAREYRDTKRDSVEAADIRVQRLQHEKDRPIEPKKLELRFAEMSPEGLRDALVANHAAGIFSADAAPTLLGKTFSRPAMISGYWSGEDRPVGLAGGNRRPVAPRLTISVMTQEDRFALYMKARGSEAFGTGLLARMLVVFPITVDLPGRSVVIEDRPEPKLDLFNQRVGDILNQAMPAPRERLPLEMSVGAKDYWKCFKEWVHDDLICGNYSDDMKSFFRKIGQQATRLAALLHYFDGAKGDISAEAMKGAIALCEWYLWEHIRVFTPYAPSQQQKGDDGAQKLLQWLQEMAFQPLKHPKLVAGRYTERDLRNYAIRNDAQKLDMAINALLYQGHITVQQGIKGGRVICYPPSQPLMPNSTNSYVPNFPVPSRFNDPFTSAHNLNNVAQHTPALHQTNENADYQHTADGSEQGLAVLDRLERSALEAGIGFVTVSVRHQSE